MATTLMQIRLDSEFKKEADRLFKNLEAEFYNPANVKKLLDGYNALKAGKGMIKEIIDE